jgi:hypothetical protein
MPERNAHRKAAFFPFPGGVRAETIKLFEKKRSTAETAKEEILLN